MREERRIVDRGRQLLVPIPAIVRDHLRLVGRAKVYWHVGTKGRATLTTTGRSSPGRPRLDEDCPSCSKYRSELDRYRRELRERDAATPGQWWRQGYMRALDDVGNVKTDVEVAVQLLNEVHAHLLRSSPGPPPPEDESREATGGPSAP